MIAAVMTYIGISLIFGSFFMIAFIANRDRIPRLDLRNALAALAIIMTAWPYMVYIVIWEGFSER